MDPEARQRQLFAAMKRITHAQGRRGPAIGVIEDLQWIDAGSEAFLENFVEALAGTRHLLVVNFRPEYHAGWMQKSYYQQMPLLPLGPDAITELLRDSIWTQFRYSIWTQMLSRNCCEICWAPTSHWPGSPSEFEIGLVETRSSSRKWCSH